MGAKRITPEEIEKMILLYDKLGTYAAVAREIKRSPDSVAKYIKKSKQHDNIAIALASSVREKRLPEPYKGKGIKYSDEVIRRKEGKTGAKK